ncbi:MAG TPA: GatB/YqeY domain-containing protein [Candidatus Saccharibacteria bacterium]|nr:GatB/YqeY domain-containing protein [Candidatus Saccharibacteria bacterium]
MALKEQINNDLKAALLGGNRFVADTLRNLKAAILNEEVALNRREEGLNDTEIEGIIAREVKKRNESKVLYEQNNRPELAEVEQNEIDVLVTYLPQQLTEDEIQVIINEVVAQMGATDMKAMGQVIGAVKAKCGTAADGATVAKLVKTTLQ